MEIDGTFDCPVCGRGYIHEHKVDCISNNATPEAIVSEMLEKCHSAIQSAEMHGPEWLFESEISRSEKLYALLQRIRIAQLPRRSPVAYRTS